MNIEELYKLYLQFPSVQTDTRKLKRGDLFFALKGPNFNGNAFAQKAIEAGAKCAIIDEKEYEVPNKTFLVKDVLKALQQLARHHRRQLNIPFLAITGSNGKTTTKELIHAVLSTSFKVYTTEGNLNNHIGVPLTILKIKPDAEIAVIEMGANHLKEIESYCKIADPTHGIITNCGKAHLVGFGSLEGVKKAKGELFDYLRQRRDGTAFVMWDYDYLQEMSKGIYNIIKYGTSDADINGRILASDPFLKLSINDHAHHTDINTQLVGGYNLPNVLAAIAVGREMKIGLPKIKQAIENYHPSNSRSQLMQKGSKKIILDAYNANPSSMKAAIENFANMEAYKKVLMLGAMAEMGADSELEHQSLIDFLKKYNWQEVVLVGKAFSPFKSEFRYFENSEEAKEWFSKQQYDNTTILVKGSRSTQMEKVIG
ncbi:MAG: UDP-N-acetylmuramoyl-tripeptide--D-alanyl-D-alanine ligase [Sphingobacteriales bacterium]|jgi:UDP-N-acetylmuramoyl-tripeptide--D-alanyl-D-alanine ligase|nr:UDP-N-acetylmuramoyl-tripeptide--D-alanyl-D-alanine ligase [Sphingobacteriales bacterium]